MVLTEKSSSGSSTIGLEDLVKTSSILVKHSGEMKKATVLGFKLDPRTNRKRFYVRLLQSPFTEIEVQSIKELQILPSTIIRKKQG